MHGFESDTFSMINADNERVWVKFHMRSQQGIENLTDEEHSGSSALTARVINVIYTKTLKKATSQKWENVYPSHDGRTSKQHALQSV